MRNSIIGLVCAATAPFLLAQPAPAGPVRTVVGKTAHIAHKTGQKIDERTISAISLHEQAAGSLVRIVLPSARFQGKCRG